MVKVNGTYEVTIRIDVHDVIAITYSDTDEVDWERTEQKIENQIHEKLGVHDYTWSAKLDPQIEKIEKVELYD